MRTNQLARYRGVRAAARLGVLVGTVGVAALAGAHVAPAATPQSTPRGIVVLADATTVTSTDGTSTAADETDPPPGDGAERSSGTSAFATGW
jgi:hypothetical protein